jgi:hypothetical protein
VAVGLGLASFVGVAISGAVYEDALNEVNGNCPGHVCPNQNRYHSALSAGARGTTAATVVNVLSGVGAGGVATGLVLFALGHGFSPKSEVALALDGVTVTGRF